MSLLRGILNVYRAFEEPKDKSVFGHSVRFSGLCTISKTTTLFEIIFHDACNCNSQSEKPLNNGKETEWLLNTSQCWQSTHCSAAWTSPSMSQNKQTSMRKKADLRQLKIMFLTTNIPTKNNFGGEKFLWFFVKPCIGTHRWNQVNLFCFKVSVKQESSILPYLSLSPTVHRNTPPKATSSPKMTAEKQEYSTVSTVSAQVCTSEKYWKLLRLSHFECFRFQ